MNPKNSYSYNYDLENQLETSFYFDILYTYCIINRYNVTHNSVYSESMINR